MSARSGEVDRYLESVLDAGRRAALTGLRETCLDLLPGFTETLRYRMPCYVRGDEPEIAFANQKQYISLYVTRTDVMAAHRDRLDGLNVGKGCIRYRRPEQIDMDVVRDILRMTASTTGPIC